MMRLKVVKKLWPKHKELVITSALILVAVISLGAIALVWQSKFAKTSSLDGRKQYNSVPEGQFKGLEKIATSNCGKLYKVKLPEKSRARFKQDLCSHGPDTAKSLGVTGSAVSEDYKVPCYGNGVSGNRVQALYVVASDKPDRYDQLLPSFRRWAGYMDAMIDKSAQKTGAHLHAKWVTDSGCQLQVAKVVVPPGGDDDFGATVGAVEEAGFHNANRKYLIWADDNWYCGVGTIVPDDRNDPYLNTNNGGPSYSRIDTPCWGNGSSAELHELFHNLGAVQNSAPHATGYGHCTDGYDVMCYKDSATTVVKNVCPADQANLLDCNNDDYLHSHPPEGSYLATHWNTFDSGFLFSVIPTNEVPPSAPTNLAAKVTSAGVVLTWSASKDDEGKPVTYKVYRSNSGQTNLYATTTTTTYTDAAVKPGAGYHYFVVAYDPIGNASAQSNTVSLFIPDKLPPPPDTTPPPALTGLSASNIGTQGFTLSWTMPADKSDIASIVVLLNNAAHATLDNTKTSANLCCGLQPDMSYAVRLKTVDAAGNTSLSSQITVKTLPVSVGTPSNIPHDLQLISINGAEIKFRATLDTTAGSWIYRIILIGQNHPADWFASGGPQVMEFWHPQTRPQNVTGLYIAMINQSGQETGRSATLPINYTGSSESNPPPAPTGFSLNTTSYNPPAIVWSPVTDDSGKVYAYHKTLTDNVTGTIRTITSDYLHVATLYGAYNIQSGRSYTFKVRAEDIWGNLSAEGSYTFNAP